MNQLPAELRVALDILSPKWTLEIIALLMLGDSRYSSIQHQLGLAKNLLSRRLKTLQRNGLVKSVPLAPGGRRRAYRLTEKGLALLPVLVALQQWGAAVNTAACAESSLVDGSTGQAIAPLELKNLSGDAVDWFAVELRPARRA